MNIRLFVARSVVSLICVVLAGCLHKPSAIIPEPDDGAGGAGAGAALAPAGSIFAGFGLLNQHFNVIEMRYADRNSGAAFLKGFGGAQADFIENLNNGTLELDGPVFISSGPLSKAASGNGETVYTNGNTKAVVRTNIGQGGNNAFLQHGEYGIYDMIDANGSGLRQVGAIFSRENQATWAIASANAGGPTATYLGRFLGQVQDPNVTYNPRRLEGDARVDVDFTTDSGTTRISNITYGVANLPVAFDIYGQIRPEISLTDEGVIRSTPVLVHPGTTDTTVATYAGSDYRARFIGPTGEEIVGGLRVESIGAAPLVGTTTHVDIVGAFGAARQ